MKILPWTDVKTVYTHTFFKHILARTTTTARNKLLTFVWLILRNIFFVEGFWNTPYGQLLILYKYYIHTYIILYKYYIKILYKYSRTMVYTILASRRIKKSKKLYKESVMPVRKKRILLLPYAIRNFDNNR